MRQEALFFKAGGRSGDIGVVQGQHGLEDMFDRQVLDRGELAARFVRGGY